MKICTDRSHSGARVKDLYGVNYWTLLNLGLAYDPKRTFGCTSHAKLDGFH